LGVSETRHLCCDVNISFVFDWHSDCCWSLYDSGLSEDVDGSLQARSRRSFIVPPSAIIVINIKPRGFGWRIHCSVEVTVLSTNKQLSLPPRGHYRVPVCITGAALSCGRKGSRMGRRSTSCTLQSCVPVCAVLLNAETVFEI
jgi:hypothetical protein